MEIIGPLLFLFGFLALAAGAVHFLPIERLRFRRRFAKRLLIGGAVALIASLIVTPTPPKNPTPRSAEPEALASAPAAKATPAPTPAPTIDSAQVARDRLVALYRQVLDEAKPCDASADTLGKAANGGSEFATYQAAKAGQDACARVAGVIADMETPDGLSDEAAATTTKAISTCAGAYRQRTSGMEKAMAFADGDHRPSILSAMMQHMKDSQTATLMCVAGFFDAAGKAGVDIKRLN